MDARVDSLQEQALGAFINHAQIQDAAPQETLDDLASFQRVLFTNHRVRALSDAVEDRCTAAGSGSAAQRTREARQGRVRARVRPVSRRSGPIDRAAPGRSISRISTQCPRPVDTVSPLAALRLRHARIASREMRELTITQPNGSKIRRTSSDPGRALLTGSPALASRPQDDWNKFDVPGLRGLRHTAPYFHNNSAATLEEVVDHYTGVFNRAKDVAPPGVVPPLLSTDGVHFDRPFVPEERAALLAYLRKL